MKIVQIHASIAKAAGCPDVNEFDTVFAISKQKAFAVIKSNSRSVFTIRLVGSGTETDKLLAHAVDYIFANTNATAIESMIRKRDIGIFESLGFKCFANGKKHIAVRKLGKRSAKERWG